MTQPRSPDGAASRADGPACLLRHAVSADLPRLVDLEQRCFNSDRLSRRSWSRLIRSPSALVTVAIERDDQLLGAAVVLFRSTSAVARIYSIAVDAAARGRGIGRHVMHRCMLDARHRGCAFVRLETRADNHAAQHLYRELGFEALDHKPDYYEDGQAAWRFERRLSAS